MNFLDKLNLPDKESVMNSTDIKGEHLLAEVCLFLGLKALKRERNCVVVSTRNDSIADAVVVLFQKRVTVFVTHCDEEKNTEDLFAEGSFVAESTTPGHYSKVKERINSSKRFQLKPGHIVYSSNDKEFSLVYYKYVREGKGDFIQFE
jgi:hypothetical protein